MSDESHVRPIFRKASKLRKPAAAVALLVLVVAFPFFAVWSMRSDFVREWRSIAGIFRD